MTSLDTTLLDTPVSLRTTRRYARREVTSLNNAFEGTDPTTVIEWATAEYGSRLCVSASFADTLLIDLAVAVDPDIEVVFIDTGFHFAETLATVRRAMTRYSLNLTVVRPSAAAADVWNHGPDTCCGSRKVAPLERHLVNNVDAWMSGLRRDDSAGRADAPIVDLDLRGLVKINPLATWSADQLARYAADNNILINPLVSQGYPSIGCWPCTTPATAVDPRSGRWANSAKTECGLH